jgi:hypothetical protein
MVGPAKTTALMPREKEQMAALTTPSKSVCVMILSHDLVKNLRTFPIDLDKILPQ